MSISTIVIIEVKGQLPLPLKTFKKMLELLIKFKKDILNMSVSFVSD